MKRRPGGQLGVARTLADDRIPRNASRRAILEAVQAEGGSSWFSKVKSATGLSDGNLSVHVRRLESFGYLTVERGWTTMRPRTTYHLTEKGRAALAVPLPVKEDPPTIWYKGHRAIAHVIDGAVSPNSLWHKARCGCEFSPRGEAGPDARRCRYCATRPRP